MLSAIPTLSGIPLRKGDFESLPQALDYAAQGESGLSFHSMRNGLVATLPYRELRLQAMALAQRLLGAGLARGDRVAIVAETAPDFVAAFFASQYAGLIPVPVPLPPPFGGREGYVVNIERLCRESRACALFAPAEILPWLAPLEAALGLKAFGTVAQLQAAGAASQRLQPTGPDEIAYLQFSSGSTRHPTGVAVRQRAAMANVSAIMRYGMQMEEGDRCVSWLPFYHDMGLVGFLLSPLAGQVSIDLLPTQDFARRPLLWLSLIAANRGTLSFSPSFGYDLCVRRRPTGATDLDLSSWRVAGIGGDMIRPRVLASFAETFAPYGFKAGALLPSYGMAEATLAISFVPPGQGVTTDTIDLDLLEREGQAVAPNANTTRQRDFVLCGAPLPGHELEIRDPEGAVLPDRRVGRVLARGPSIMLGYDGKPELTAEVLSPDGWLDTGDLGYCVDGNVVITGRAKDLIIINGRNVWPQDLEWTIEHQVPGVRTGDVAAFSHEEDGQEALILLVEARGVPDAAARERLVTEVTGTVRAQHGLESHVVLVPPGSLPQTSSGKLSRAWSKRKYLAGDFALQPR
jgi:fatty-acyl-CoA synthase